MYLLSVCYLCAAMLLAEAGRMKNSQGTTGENNESFTI